MEANWYGLSSSLGAALRKTFGGGEVRIEPPDQIKGGLFPNGKGRPFLLLLGRGLHTQRRGREILNASDPSVCWIKIPWK